MLPLLRYDGYVLDIPLADGIEEFVSAIKSTGTRRGKELILIQVRFHSVLAKHSFPLCSIWLAGLRGLSQQRYTIGHNTSPRHGAPSSKAPIGLLLERKILCVDVSTALEHGLFRKRITVAAAAAAASATRLVHLVLDFRYSDMSCPRPLVGQSVRPGMSLSPRLLDRLVPNIHRFSLMTYDYRPSTADTQTGNT